MNSYKTYIILFIFGMLAITAPIHAAKKNRSVGSSFFALQANTDWLTSSRQVGFVENRCSGTKLKEELPVGRSFKFTSSNWDDITEMSYFLYTVTNSTDQDTGAPTEGPLSSLFEVLIFKDQEHYKMNFTSYALDGNSTTVSDTSIIDNNHDSFIIIITRSPIGYYIEAYQLDKDVWSSKSYGPYPASMNRGPTSVTSIGPSELRVYVSEDVELDQTNLKCLPILLAPKEEDLNDEETTTVAPTEANK